MDKRALDRYLSQSDSDAHPERYEEIEETKEERHDQPKRWTWRQRSGFYTVHLYLGGEGRSLCGMIKEYPVQGKNIHRPKDYEMCGKCVQFSKLKGRRS